MATSFQFGLVVQGQGEHKALWFGETIELVRLAERLGYHSIAKAAHYSAHPWQMLQLVPMFARFTAEAPRLRLNAGAVLPPLLSPLRVAEEFATLDVMSGRKIIIGVGLGFRDVEFQAFGVPRSQAGAATRGQPDRDTTPIDRRQGHDEGAVFRTRRCDVLVEAGAKAASADLGRSRCRPCDRTRRSPRRPLVH